MELVTKEDAQAIVAEFSDRLGKKVDPQIEEALVQFIRITETLGFETYSSCEGHVDWGNPYPAIKFGVPVNKVPRHPWWKFWCWHRLPGVRAHQRRHAQNPEAKTTQLCFFFTRLILLHAVDLGIKVEATVRVERLGAHRFMIIPVYTDLSESCKISGDHKELSRLLKCQRHTFLTLSAFIVETLQHSENFMGVPDDGCQGCMGRI